MPPCQVVYYIKTATKMRASKWRYCNKCKREPSYDVDEETHLMFLIVVLIFSASAIALPPLGPRSFHDKLQTREGYKIGIIRILLPR